MNRRADAPQRAVLYLRVSTVSQVTTDYDPEGISIPAQRAACQRKAEQLGIEIVDEYVEPGRSGTSMKSRPAFQAMLKRIRQDRDVDAVLVYKLSRMNRNWEESAQVIMQLRAAKAQLLSATENIDATPGGRLTLGIMSAINEFRSAEDGEDIRYKMGEKAKRGGTINKAPLGYKNVREEFEGRLVPSVALDPERAPLIRQAFELYASGDYSLDRLTQTMADLGLRSRPTKRFPAKPVSLEQLRLILANPYYTGVLVYQGALYPGRHEAIIDAPLFERVQEVADLRSRRGSRDHIHQHFLKGMLFCGRCQKAGREHRLILTEARGRSGYYFYFLCRGRQEGECDLPYLRVEQVEDAVEREYATLALPADFAEQVEERVAETIADEQQSTRLLRTNLGAELQRLNAAEERLIDLAAEGTLPAGKVRSRLTKLQQDRERVSGQLETVEHDLAEERVR
jgi:site-specific DNA recombinase